MYTYNTTTPPILLKKYGRKLQNIIAYIAEIKDRQKQEPYIEALLQVIQNISSQKQNPPTMVNLNQIFNEIFIASSEKLNLNPSNIKRSTNIKTKQLTYTHPVFSFKCCGTHLTKIIHIVLNKDTKKQSSKEHIIALVKLVHTLHKTKYNIANTIQHIEQVIQDKIALAPEEIEKALQLKVTSDKTYASSKQKNKKH